MILDAIGNPIREGWALYTQLGRGSVSFTKVYVVKPHGKASAKVLEFRDIQGDYKELVKAHLEGIKDLPTSTLRNTRVIMYTQDAVLNIEEPMKC